MSNNHSAVSSHISIAITLIALTGLNVFIHSLDIGPENATRLILFIAAIQAFLILEFLMHLIDGERATIAIVFSTIGLVGALFFISYMTFHNSYGETIHPERPQTTTAAESETH